MVARIGSVKFNVIFHLYLHPHIESSKKKIVSNSFIHKAPEIWSKLPAVIKDCPSISSFSKRMKKYLYSSY